MLPAEAHSISETWANLQDVFGLTKDEPDSILRDGLNIEGRNYKVKIYFVGDFKVYYTVLGIHTAGSMYLCPWCLTPLQHMSFLIENIHETNLCHRPLMVDKTNELLNSPWKKRGTHNIFSLSINLENHEMVTLVQPPLHIKMGIIIKIVDSLDSIVVDLDKKHLLKDENGSIFRSL